ncbi:MAG: cupin domain-containing protein [Pseudomonadaceae bacterium]|nr:cupin domain-containing protein [Pseudomonadaceae bacterium]
MSLLADLDPAQFLREYWQRKPLMVRSALPGFVSAISGEELAGLSLEPQIESRIVLEDGDASPWQLLRGPFDESVYSKLPESGWTLLVQAVDLWLPEVADILQRVDFLPRWRMDDVMISYAPAGGSVGPHFDQYDVFLLQAEGTRRWQLGAACDADTKLLAGPELSIVADFEAVDEWLLEPGDMLYVPPGIAHWGVAMTDCITYSIGFRSPSLPDLMADLSLEMLKAKNPARYRDPALTPAMATEQIHPAFLAQLKSQLVAMLDDDAVLADWFARFMTRPKYPEIIEATEERRSVTIAGQRYVNGEPANDADETG